MNTTGILLTVLLNDHMPPNKHEKGTGYQLFIQSTWFPLSLTGYNPCYSGCNSGNQRKAFLNFQKHASAKYKTIT